MARWLRVFLFTLGVAGLALATLPWWLGGALGPILRARGISFERYERAGYAHFQLRGVLYANSAVNISAKQIQSATPLVWLAQRLRGTEPEVVVESWQLQRITGAASAAQRASAIKPVQGLPDLLAVVQQLSPRLVTWLPQVRLSAGEVRGFGVDATITSAFWQNGRLSVAGLGVAGRSLAFVLGPAADGALVLTAHTVENDARLQLRWTGAEIKGEAVLWDQPLHLSARFPAQGWLPTEASALAENWNLPAARVKLGTPYSQVRGDARLIWRNQTFDLSVNAKAEPAADTKTKAPPFEASATAHGNLRELTLTTLHLNAPFATATLTAPITFGFDHPLSAESARLVVQADLAKLPWIDARGTAQGSITVTGDTAAARQTFALKFSDVALRDFTIKSAQANGVLAWPHLELSQLQVQLDDTSSFEAHGAVNWQTRELTGVALQAKFGSAWFARWLPAGVGWTGAEVSATAEGPLAAPRHQGSLKLTAAQWPPLHPLALDATWRGVGAAAEISARAVAKDSSLELAGSLVPHGLQLTKLLFSPGGQPDWQLAAPARITWSPLWQIDNLRLTGPDSQLTLKGAGGPAGSVALSVTHLLSSWLQDWVTITGPAWQVQTLQASGQLVERTLVFDAALAAQIEMAPQPAQVTLVAHGDAHGVELKKFQVLAAARVLTQATGRLPLSVAMEPSPHLVFDEAAPLELSAATETDSPLWATLTAYTGIALTKPAAKINLKGTLRQPVGELQVSAAQLGVTPGRFKVSLPELEEFVLAVQFDRSAVKVATFSAKLAGQPVSLSGQTPMDDGRWQQLWRAPAAFDWSKVTAQVEITDADLAPLARQLPDFPLAQGRLSAQVTLAPGAKFSGELQLTDAVSRPLAAFGALRDLNANLVLADRLITVRTLTTKLGSEPVTVDGCVTLVPGGAPRLALGLKGQNLPLVRNTGLLLRANLDLRADTDAADQTRLSGTVTVRDCLVLANVNLRTLLPSGRRGVARQPPYFSVEAEPFGHWPLAVELRAPGAIRVRTTAYNGTASAHFQLSGTLGEPRAVGELTVDQGQVLFPFATFKVQQGAVRLREADPFRAVVSLNAASQRRDYQLRLEMTGELPAPNIAISSTPTLEAADVLLMVMTGQPPANDTTTAASSGPRLALLGAYLGRGLFQDLGFGGEDRLEISAGEHISRQGRETYEFEYKLGERWSLLGEYDVYDRYNAGLKWRVYTEESKADAKK